MLALTFSDSRYEAGAAPGAHIRYFGDYEILR